MIGKGIKMALSYLDAKFGGEALPEVQLNRLATCFECDWMLIERRNEANQLDVNGDLVDNPYFYCKKCGCPKTRFWKDSELKTKVTYQNAKCPLNKWNP